jgi:hypothetical protein
MTTETLNLAKVIKGLSKVVRELGVDSEHDQAQLRAFIYVMKDYARYLPEEEVRPFFEECGFPKADPYPSFVKPVSA